MMVMIKMTMMKKIMVENEMMKKVQRLMFDKIQNLLRMILVVSVNAREGTTEMENYMLESHCACVRPVPTLVTPDRCR